jgi:predicted permease
VTWWGRLFRRRPLEAQLDAELRDHVERQVADYVRAGMSEPDARRRARLEFGGLDQVKDQCRDVRGTRVIEEIVRDVRYACRVLRKSPGFTFAAIASLALGIGATTAIFSLIDAAMLKSLPVREPERLIELLTDRGKGQPYNSFSGPALAYFRDHATTLDGVIASHTTRFFVVVDNAAPELAGGQYVTGNFFEMLGVRTVIGRTVYSSDDRPNAEPVAVLSHAYWHRRFGADPLAVGRRMTIDDHVFTVVGVAPPAFHGTLVGREIDVWIPLSAEPVLRKRSWMGRAGTKWLQILGRLKTGTSYEQARAELQMLFQAAVVDPEVALMKEARLTLPAETWHLAVEPAHAGQSAVRRQYGAPLLVLLAISGLVLGIACVNVANLLLTRASARRQEIAIRLSLGAARARVVRQLLTESLLLATAGAAVGIALAYTGCRYLLAFFRTSRTPIALEVGPDLRMLAFTGALAVATGLLFGLAPAWRATVRAPGTSLIGSGRMRGSRDRQVLSRMLIAGQVALSVMMLFSAGLFLRSLHNLHSIDTGFDSSSVLLISTDASRSRLTPDAQRAAFRETLARFAALPGAQAASLSHTTPIEGGGTMRTLQLEGNAGEARRDAGSVHLNWVSPGYFATMSTPIHSGRDFTWQDTPASPKVAIINQRMARQYFGNESALGRRISMDGVTYEIVAVAGDAKYLEIRDVVPPSMYFSAFQLPFVSGQLAIRTAGRPGDMAAAARDVLRAVAPAIAVTSVRSLQEQIDASIVGERMLGALSGFFAALGLLLASVGLYGVMSYTVSRRTGEIGIRIALGAAPSRISAMVVREALMLTAGGVVAGIAGALLLSRTLASLLYGLTPNDPLTMWSVIAVMSLTGLAAAYLPSRRAGRLDPTVALRHE